VAEHQTEMSSSSAASAERASVGQELIAGPRLISRRVHRSLHEIIDEGADRPPSSTSTTSRGEGHLLGLNDYVVSQERRSARSRWPSHH